MPDFLLFSQLFMNQQKVPSSNQVGEQEIVRTDTEKKKKKVVFFFVLARSQGHKKVLRCRLTDI